MDGDKIMPLYEYTNDETGDIISIVQSMNDVHEYIDETGKKWRRVFTVPQMGVDTKFDEWDSKSFAEKSGKKIGTLGNLFDQSQELSNKREKSAGVDPLKESHLKKWKERRRRKDGSLPKHSSEVARSISIVAE